MLNGLAKVSGRFNSTRPLSVGQSMNSVRRQSRRGAAKVGTATSRQVTKSTNVRSKPGFGGAGLTTMRQNKVSTNMISHAGMGIAANVRNSGPRSMSRY